ncbi:ferrous iron transporter B [Piscinibacter sakaiensis]|uniref:ferrous iron transporter B n=1 Tax=Piscinibacter sakaiensis TaxID=1547922 RepID=UPI003728CB49
MHEAVVHLHPPGRLLALVGNPNCGKTALFNRLTGSHQKVANYAGVTIERKEGRLTSAAGRVLRLLDLPGVYSLNPRSPDEAVTVRVLNGQAVGEKRPDLVVCVVDATNLRRNLRLVLAVRRTGLPCVVALNMVDLAERQGLRIDAAALGRELGVPHAAVRGILERLGLADAVPHTTSDRIDRVVLHPVAGPLLLGVLLFLVFQAVFAWAETPKGWIEAATAWCGDRLGQALAEGPLRSLLVDGVIAGVGGVLVFLPQILILFFFILVLEESGYLPRAAFLLDRLMGGVGLSGRSFIPLLSSFACAIPGILAARTVSNPRDRLVTVMIAPLMTCSARLPVYALLIGAFVPQHEVLGGLELQGLVLFGLYLAGIVGALGVAWVAKRLSAGGQTRSLMMELPRYHWPTLRNLAIGLWQRAQIFLRRVGGIILALTIVLWFLASVPSPPPDATGPAIQYSLAGLLGRALAVVFEPIGFNWQISIALVPGLAAREVAVSALGTVYALSATGDDTAQALAPLIAHGWSLATAFSLLAWYVFAPMCLATLATLRREAGLRWAALAAAYLFALAYAAAFVTYRVTLWATG